MSGDGAVERVRLTAEERETVRAALASGDRIAAFHETFWDRMTECAAPAVEAIFTARLAAAEDQARGEAGEAVRKALASITTHNGTPPTAKNLRWAATHEALCRSWIYDVLMGLADAADLPTGSGGGEG